MIVRWRRASPAWRAPATSTDPQGRYQVRVDDVAHTANVSIRVEEIGQQRASLIGGNGQFGSTLGIAYTVFDLLNREELLSAQLEGGPESLQIMLGLAKEGIFGTRASLAFSVFNNVLRPRFASSAQGPFFTSHNAGINIPWTYAASNRDSLAVSYTLSRATTDYKVLSLRRQPASFPAKFEQESPAEHSARVGT